MTGDARTRRRPVVIALLVVLVAVTVPAGLAIAGRAGVAAALTVAFLAAWAYRLWELR